MSSQAIVPGSIQALAQRDGQSIAETFLSADVVVLVDTSSSMLTRDSRNGLSRYEVACQELAALQATLPGKIAVFGFASWPQFCPGGLPNEPVGSTDLTKALRFVKPADGTARFIVVSDGEPDSEATALEVAKLFESQIDCVYTGSEVGIGGRQFLAKLAKARGGRVVDAKAAVELAQVVEQLLLKAG